ncbi:MAG: hypothetical protein M0C28_48155 [Candidatus Moduliflexus flocculans]|nr:hypothetical protein [Candidatus Moduliflexus flocculans]
MLRFGRNNRLFVIWSGEFNNIFQGFKPHYGNEFRFRRHFPSEKLDAFIAFDIPTLYANEYLASEKILIFVSVAFGCVTMPDSRDHLFNLYCWAR